MHKSIESLDPRRRGIRTPAAAGGAGPRVAPRAACPPSRSAPASPARCRSCGAPSTRGWRARCAPPAGSPAGRAKKLWDGGPRILGTRVTATLARAIATLEVNAAMGLIVAAPTAGAAGVLPAILITVDEFAEGGMGEERLVDAMLVAGGVGGVIAQRASLAGAEGGCQAETGTAAAMGAAAVTWLHGGIARADLHGHRALPAGDAGADLRPHRRAGGDPLHLPQRVRGHAGHRRGRDGAGGAGLSRLRGRGDRRDGRGGAPHAQRLPRDGAWAGWPPPPRRASWCRSSPRRGPRGEPVQPRGRATAVHPLSARNERGGGRGEGPLARGRGSSPPRQSALRASFPAAKPERLDTPPPG